MNFTSELVVAVLAGVVVVVIQYYFFEKKNRNDSSEVRIRYETIPIPETRSVVVATLTVECAQCHTGNKKENRHCIKCGYHLYEDCPNCAFVKPVIEARCANCGKDPRELLYVDRKINSLIKKALIILIAYGILVLRAISLSEKPSLVDFLSVCVVLAGIIYLMLETAEEVQWLSDAKLLDYEYGWLETTSKNLSRSFWIFLLVTLSWPIPVFVILSKIAAWIKQLF